MPSLHGQEHAFKCAPGATHTIPFFFFSSTESPLPEIEQVLEKNVKTNRINSSSIHTELGLIEK